MKAFILTGEVGEGKTSVLLDFTRQNKCSGILTLKIKGKRHFLNIGNGQTKILEVKTDNTKEVLQVGKYFFDKGAFDWARNLLLNEAQGDSSTVIIDEYGHLELKGSGFEPLLENLVKSIRNSNKNLIVVVRNNLLEKFQKKFNLTEWEVLELNDLSKIKF